MEDIWEKESLFKNLIRNFGQIQRWGGGVRWQKKQSGDGFAKSLVSLNQRSSPATRWEMGSLQSPTAGQRSISSQWEEGRSKVARSVK